jgi:NAD(P)-dependent dehydrogenase (short-subunit alcohol dehydrogenase family)
LRIGGFEGLTNKQIENATNVLLPYLGEKKDIIESEAAKLAEIITKETGDTTIGAENHQKILLKLLEKVQEIAEKIQNNTKKMIIDKEFLTQDDVAEMVYNLSTDTFSKLINGKIIPNDRVFYPVKPIVDKNIDVDPGLALQGNTILITTTTNEVNDLGIIKKIADRIAIEKVKQIIILSHKNEVSDKANDIFKGFHHHNIDLGNEDAVNRIFNTIQTHFGKINSTIHFTGSYDYGKDITSLSRMEWDHLVNNFIYIPHLVTRASVLSISSQEALENPDKFKGSFGNIVIIGPEAPRGGKIEGKIRARSEIFRGALRPYVTTANQELHEVLNSKINLTLILQGSISGELPAYEKLQTTVLGLCSQKELKNNLIIYLNE